MMNELDKNQDKNSAVTASKLKAKIKRKTKASKSSIEGAATDFLIDGKKLANEVYNEGLSKLNEAEANLKEYSDDILVKIQKNPLASVLVAAGVGFLLSSIIRK